MNLNNQQFDRVLDSCLTMLQQGATVEDCLKKYPNWEQDLRPILELSSQVIDMPKPRATSAAVNSNRAKMMSALAEQASAKPNFERPVSFRNFLRYASQMNPFTSKKENVSTMNYLRLTTVMATLIIGFVVGNSVVKSSIPGDAFYEVKLLTEETRELIASGDRIDEIKQRHTQNRLDELTAMQAQNRSGSITIEGPITVVDEDTLLINGLEIDPADYSVEPSTIQQAASLDITFEAGQILTTEFNEPLGPILIENGRQESQSDNFGSAEVADNGQDQDVSEPDPEASPTINELNLDPNSPDSIPLNLTVSASGLSSNEDVYISFRDIESNHVFVNLELLSDGQNGRGEVTVYLLNGEWNFNANLNSSEGQFFTKGGVLTIDGETAFDLILDDETQLTEISADEIVASDFNEYLAPQGAPVIAGQPTEVRLSNGTTAFIPADSVESDVSPDNLGLETGNFFPLNGELQPIGINYLFTAFADSDNLEPIFELTFDIPVTIIVPYPPGIEQVMDPADLEVLVQTIPEALDSVSPQAVENVQVNSDDKTLIFTTKQLGYFGIAAPAELLAGMQIDLSYDSTIDAGFQDEPIKFDSPTQLTGSTGLGGFIYDPDNFSVMKDIGMNWVTHQVIWTGGNDLGNVEDLIQAGHSNGMNVLLKVGGSPYPTSIDFASYVQFLNDIASLPDPPDAISVWNEMNIDFSWPTGQISPQTYVDSMLAPAYSAIKQANPTIAVISGAPAPTGFFGGQCTNTGCDDDAYLRGMAEAGAAQYIDCVGVHYNAGATSPSATTGHPADGATGHYSWYFGPMVDTYSSAFNDEVPICFTEIGYLTSEGFNAISPRFSWSNETSLEEQAAWLAEAYSISKDDPRIQLLNVFNVDSTFYDTDGDPQAGFALIRLDGSCPACETLKAVSEQ